MTRGILIVGNESSLFSAISAEALKRVTAFASVSVPNRFLFPEGLRVSPPETEASTGPLPLAWNPASPISARTLLVAAENKLKQINNAIVICSPPAVFKSAETLTPEDIEILVNDHIKGWFFLIRELILYFRRRGDGSLSLVAPEIAGGGNGKNAPADFAGPSASASFRAFASGVLAGTGFQAMGFTSAEADNEADFAAWLFKIIDEGAAKNSGRWHKYSRLKIFR